MTRGPRGGTFSARGPAEYGGGAFSPVLVRGGGGRMLFLETGGLSLSVRLSCKLTVSDEVIAIVLKVCGSIDDSWGGLDLIPR